MPINDPSIESLQPFLVEVSLAHTPIYCGDERPSDIEVYIHWFGGIANPIFNDAVYSEAEAPGSVTHSFKDIVANALPVYRASAGLIPGVHSDLATEKAETFDLGHVGPEIGCGYLFKRAQISQLIAQQGEMILQKAESLFPELFSPAGSLDYAQKVLQAHRDLAERVSFNSAGREVAFAAINSGALFMNVTGAHIARDGVINLDPSYSLNTTKAFNAGRPTYWHDAELVEYAQSKVAVSSSQKRRLVNLIDTLGTMHALGVKNIFINRPVDILQMA